MPAETAVDDPVGGYKSDYDILVVVSDDRLTDVVDYWAAAADRLMRDMTISSVLSAPVGLIVHSLKDVNKQLDQGRPFFIDITEQGIALYEAEGFGLAMPRKLPAEEARAEAQKHFDRWFTLAVQSYRTFELQKSEGRSQTWRSDAAFTLHQAVERLYHCTMLVLTLYSPKSHKLNFLRGLAEDVAPELIAAWPRDDKFSRLVCPLLSGPKLMIFWITKETRNAEQEASPGRDYRQAALRLPPRLASEIRIS